MIDQYRFPWVREREAPTADARATALNASAVLLAAQRTETERRNAGKEQQEALVKDYLCGMGLDQVAPTAIRTVVDGLAAGQFCGECQLGERKADVVLRLDDTRRLPTGRRLSASGRLYLRRCCQVSST